MKPHKILLFVSIAALLVIAHGCATTGDGTQGHTSWTAFFAALAAAIVAFVTAPLDALVAIGAGIAIALAFLAFSPKYPLNPPRTPDGHVVQPTKPEKSFVDKTWWEVIHG